MKKLEKLKLTQLGKAELEERQLSALKGGTNDDYTCFCNCSSESTHSATLNANSVYGYQYSYGGDGTYAGAVVCGCPGSVSMSNVRGS
jgi:natural product precursor